MPDRVIIENCAPTLAGIKTANLISLKYEEAETAKQDLRELNRIFVKKGLRAVPLRYRGGHVLVYIYRPERLCSDLREPGIYEFLRKLGYRDPVRDGSAPLSASAEADSFVVQLADRMKKSEEFPHEIGLFLGYALEDVRGFIEHKEVGCKLVGFWRVYGDEKRAKQIFAQYRECIRAYTKSYEKGRTIAQLTV